MKNMIKKIAKGVGIGLVALTINCADNTPKQDKKIIEGTELAGFYKTALPDEDITKVRMWARRNQGNVKYCDAEVTYTIYTDKRTIYIKDRDLDGTMDLFEAKSTEKRGLRDFSVSEGLKKEDELGKSLLYILQQEEALEPSDKFMMAIDHEYMSKECRGK